MSGFPAVQLRICNQDGSYGTVLDADGLVAFDLTLVDGEPNAIKFDFDAQHPHAALLEDLVVVAVLVGGVEYSDMRFVLDDSGRDEVIDEETVSWSALSVLGQLDYGVVLPDLGDLENSVGFPLPDVTPGFAARVLIEKCQSRGALPWVSWDFTDGHDSAGQPWPNDSRLTEIVEQGTTVLGFLTKLHERDVASARMDGTTLQLFVYGNQGVDRSQDADGLLLRGRDLEDGPWNSTSRDARSVMYARGELPRPQDYQPPEGSEETTTGIPILVSETNTSANQRFGVREGWLSQQQVQSESQLRAIASGSLALTNRARDSYTYKLTMAGPLPIVDYSKGDVLQVRVRGRDRQMRVRTITINVDADGQLTGSAGFGDRFMDADEELQRALDRLTGQSMDGGLYGAPIVSLPAAEDEAALVRVHLQATDPAVWAKLKALGYQGILTPSGEALYVPRKVLDDVKKGLEVTNTDQDDDVRDAVPPGPVENLGATSFPLISGTNLNTTEIRLTWTAPDDDDVAWYEIQWQDLEYLRDQDTGWWNTGAQVSASAGSGTGWSHGLRRPGVLYRYRVRAIDTWYNVSTWAYVEHRAAKYLEAPVQNPSTPGVEAILYSALRVTWDGLDDEGVAFTPFPVFTVQVHASTTANFTASSSTWRGLITVVEGGSGELVVHDLSPGDTWYVRLLPVSPWGIPGEPSSASATASGVPLDVFSQTLPDGSIDPSKLSFNPGDGNLTPDGSFERAAWRAETTASGLWTMVDSGQYGGPKVAGKPAASGFVNAGVSTLAPLSNPTTVAQWTKQTAPPPNWAAFPTRMNTTPFSLVGGRVRKTGSGFAAAISPLTAFDPTMLYQVRLQVQVVTDSTNPVADQTMAVGLSPINAQGQFLNDSGGAQSSWYGPKIPASRPVFAANGIQTITAWYRGTGPQVTGTGGTSTNPMTVPVNTAFIGAQVWLDYDAADPSLANTVVEIVSCTIRPMTGATYDGDWVYDFAAAPLTWQRMDLVDSYPTKGDDVFYVVGRWRLMGDRTNQPIAYFVGVFKDAAGNTLFTSFVRKSGGWTHDGWFVVENRLSMGAEEQDFRPAGNVASVEIYAAAWNVGNGQTLRVDAIEVRRAMTNVLIHNLAVTDAKIRDLSVSKLTAGTVNAQVVVGNQISTAQQPGSLARVALLSRTASGTGYAAFAATSDAGVASVLINGETGGATFGGTITAAEVNGWLRSRYGNAYIELTNAVTDWTSGTGPGVQWVSDLAYYRTPASVKLNNNFVALTPSMMHLRGTAQNLATASQFSHGVIYNRLNDTPAADVESVSGETKMIHPHGEFWFDDTTFGNPRGQGVTFAITGNYNGQGTAGIRLWRDGTDPTANWIDIIRMASPSSQHLWCGLRCDTVRANTNYGLMSLSSTKDYIEPVKFSALSLISDNPAMAWDRDQPEGRMWRIGPMSDDLPEEVAPEGYLSLNSSIGVLWRGIEELVERDQDLRLQLRSVMRRIEELEAA